jgi:hypothetical protein
VAELDVAAGVEVVDDCAGAVGVRESRIAKSTFRMVVMVVNLLCFQPPIVDQLASPYKAQAYKKRDQIIFIGRLGQSKHASSLTGRVFA